MHNKQKMDAARITGTASGKAWDNSGSMLVILVKWSLIAFHMSTLWIKYNISTTVYTFINHTVISSCFYPFISAFAFIISCASHILCIRKIVPCEQAIFHHYIISMVFSYIVFVFLSHLSFPGILYSIKKIGGIYHE